jgi:hypothetical protein
VDGFRFDDPLIAERVSLQTSNPAGRTGGESRRGHRSYALPMRDSPLSPQKIRTVAAAYAGLRPQYSAVVVAPSLERVDQEIAGRAGARLAGMGQLEPPTGLDGRPDPLKGVGVGVAVGAITLLVAGRSLDERLPGLLGVLLALVAACAVVADWAERHWAERHWGWRHWGGRAPVRTGPRAGQG